jgi:hypothetical protein
VAYIPAWESLADVLRRVVSASKSDVHAKNEICNAIADRAIGVRVFINGQSGGNGYEGGNVRVPQLLRPDDFDWSQSRPFEPWWIGPMPGQHYFWEPERMPIDLVQLSTADVERIFGPSPISQTGDAAEQRGGKRLRIKTYLAEHYRDGVDGPGLLPRKKLRKDLIAWDSDLGPLDDETLKRAIDEYNHSLKRK